MNRLLSTIVVMVYVIWFAMYPEPKNDSEQ